ncbi:MAG: aldehyde ferredoxin oxidoreductase family protein [Chloroflexi bacterium]|nr:aldehyde ferredoxin oxidoreductase family protein [Chloroflexota bacterium]
MAPFEAKILDIDLTTGRSKTSVVPKDVTRKFIGGSGLAAKMFLDRVSPKVDPLSPENVLFITTGPLSGTTMPGGSRFSVCAKSPLTDIWGESSCGGSFAAWLRSAGFEGVAVSGASKKPVYLVIKDGKAEIKDAADLWGKNTYEIIDLLRERHGGEKNASVLTIGQAGEKQVRYAAIANEKRDFAGRCGMGAVMGSKKLKAIVAVGTGKVETAVPDVFSTKRKDYTAKAKDHFIVQVIKQGGTNGALDFGVMLGDLPGKNWAAGDMMAFGPKIGGAMLNSPQFLTGTDQCHGCLVGCKRVVSIKEGPYQLKAAAGPEYEGVGSLGSLLMIDDMAAIIRMNEMCNDYGMDVISCGATIAMAMDCYERGIITSKETGGIELKWGDASGVIKMIDMIATRRGFGDVLAEGAKRGAEKIGKNASEFAVVVKGLEVPMHDPRAFHGLALSYATGVRGACHTNDLTYSIEQGIVVWPEAGIPGGYQQKSSAGKAPMVVTSQNLGQVVNAAPVCYMVMSVISSQELVDLLSAASGFDYTLAELLTAGERIWLLKRGLGNLMGATAADDRVPKQMLTSPPSGPAVGSVPDLDMMLKEYYPLRGLDARGVPTKEKLGALGLSDLAAKL